ncbi:Fanconi anemia group J protein homolog isoform X2 [Vespula pensylvanica]|uniref:Fanconi anemia group J protein homolog isoform X2 n=1 Tax=Vespula pensylvanica TaxID=30213 RepID=UPI001CB9F268|nr:Fanconi anemia group J protein homolog isoform X2 [Vespula pensylvanica]
MHVTLITIIVIATIFYYLIKFYVEDWFYDLEMDSSKSKGDKERVDTDVFEISSDESSTEEERIKNSLPLGNALKQKYSSIKEYININSNPTDSVYKKKDPILLDISMESDSNNSDNFNQLSTLKQGQSCVEKSSSIDINPKRSYKKTAPNVFDISTDTDSDISDDFTQSSCASHAARMTLFSWKKQKRVSADSEDDNNAKRKNMSIVFDNTSESTSKTKQSKIRKLSERQRFTKNKDTPIKYLEPPIPPIISEEIETKEFPMTDITQHELIIAGSKVKFPVKPYPCQFAVMNILIQSCTKATHCLVESPTGSGKTLALLCGVLAWQDSYNEQIEKEFKELTKLSESMDNLDGQKSEYHDEENDDCIVIEPTSSHASSDGSKKPSFEDIIYLDDLSNDNKENTRLKVPKIYYGTRTHRQLKQVIKELGRTSYRHKKMTILSSREHTCIQDTTTNKSEFCYNLLDPEKELGCLYYNEKNKKDLSTFSQLESNGITMPYDIEDLVEVGRKNHVCPYFAAKSLAEEAEIIFCPYNYIIDPDIRESMQINLKNEIIVLDEAHNIEDICRNVAGADFREDELRSILADCGTLKSMEFIEERDAYSIINSYIEGLIDFINSITLNPTDKDDEMNGPYWTGSELLELFNMHNIGTSKCVLIMSAAQIAISEFNNTRENLRVMKHDKSNKNKKTISRSTKIVLQRLIFALKKIASEEYANDYRAYVSESFVSDIWYKVPDDTWSSQRSGKRLRSLKLICMNPAVIFAPLAREARSIILASGTLTPTTSFQSELGTKFAYILTANHVIDSDQVYITCVPKGPTGVSLKANYQNVNSWNFQDELGRLLVKVCQSVPHGVLCFFSSYYMMNNQIKRWKNNNFWHNIERYKRIFIEPRNNNDLEQVMREYREVIEETSEIDSNNIETLSGAILFAVFRGKVAEGIDFSDDEARCVITVGIPYPVKKDPEIEMKWAYNDKNTSKGLVKGSDWYTIQAFKALNQALGRCIRHRNDWGAVLLVDERFQSSANINNLPKWIRMRVSFNEGLSCYLNRTNFFDYNCFLLFLFFFFL